MELVMAKKYIKKWTMSEIDSLKIDCIKMMRMWTKLLHGQSFDVGRTFLSVSSSIVLSLSRGYILYTLRQIFDTRFQKIRFSSSLFDFHFHLYSSNDAAANFVSRIYAYVAAIATCFMWWCSEIREIRIFIIAKRDKTISRDDIK